MKEKIYCNFSESQMDVRKSILYGIAHHFLYLMHINRKLIRSMLRVWKSITLLKHFLRAYFALIFFTSFINHQSCLKCRYTEPALYTTIYYDNTDFRPLHMFQPTSTLIMQHTYGFNIFTSIYVQLSIYTSSMY